MAHFKPSVCSFSSDSTGTGSGFQYTYKAVGCDADKSDDGPQCPEASVSPTPTAAIVLPNLGLNVTDSGINAKDLGLDERNNELNLAAIREQPIEGPARKKRGTTPQAATAQKKRYLLFYEA